MDHVLKLFRKKCNVCRRERVTASASCSTNPREWENAEDGSSGAKECKRADSAEDGKAFLPAPLAHYCCICARAVGWTHFDTSACVRCKHSEAAGGDAQMAAPSCGDDWSSPISAAADTVLPPNEAAADDSYVQIAFRDEGVEEEAANLEKAARLALVQKECEAIRAAAIEQATREAEDKVSRILADAQNSARQQAAEEREQLVNEARMQAQAIIEEGKQTAKQEIERVLHEADKILNQASAEAASLVDEARTSVAPAGAWVEIGLSGTGGWHRPGMCVFFRGELAAACDNFSAHSCVGSGGFGSVFRAQVRAGPASVACQAAGRVFCLRGPG